MAPDAFIELWADSGGGERSNCHSFVNDLCDVLGVPRPAPVREDDHRNDYVFEKSVPRREVCGARRTRFIDVYKRDCFILEAKQSAIRTPLATWAPSPGPLTPPGRFKRGSAKRGTPGWEASMAKARAQALAYVALLPADHARPPFLIIVDIGHVIELWAGFDPRTDHYRPFPSADGDRIALGDLRHAEIRARLRRVWLDPWSLTRARTRRADRPQSMGAPALTPAPILARAPRAAAIPVANAAWSR